MELCPSISPETLSYALDQDCNTKNASDIPLPKNTNKQVTLTHLKTQTEDEW